MEKFTADNFKKGFLVDEELMAGITENPDTPGLYIAYVVRHTTGETLGNQQFEDLFEAIRTINDIQRDWSFEAISKCGGGGTCGGSGKCGGTGSCGDKHSHDHDHSHDDHSHDDDH
jgi:hypothetical protein